ncbi:protein rolling stone-like isoform X2 [Dreissena polymorpha]|uniref:protein rolling stone-like isoform X2 n=1 Tax=Dreissena polymorpha TaxID=45954 RepID=UPI002264579A|nr:protein rolling stone-like isoform X2 [Dreissena polymorpha]
MGELGKQCRNQFRLECFLLSHRNPRRFVQYQCGNQPLYLVWRVFWALYHTAWIIVTGVRADQWAGPDRSQYTKWFIFLTDWAYLCLTIATIADAMVTTYIHFKRMDIRKGAAASLPWYLRADWCLTTTAHVVSVVTSAAYWGLVYSGDEVTAVDIETHVIHRVYVILNVCVTGMLMRILHFWFPTLFGLTYSLFSLFYHLAG